MTGVGDHQAADSARAIVSRIEMMSYTDYSQVTTADVQRVEGVTPQSFASSQSPWSKEPPFPLKLHKILSDMGECDDAIRWLPHGRAWKIVDQKKFETSVLEKHFRHSRFLSFMRQVTGWDFKRITSGDDEGAYYHEYFLRGLPHVCLKMRRKTGGKASSRASSAFSRMTIARIAPDFQRISELHPLPLTEEDVESESAAAAASRVPAPAEISSSSTGAGASASTVSSHSGAYGIGGVQPQQALPQHRIPAPHEPVGVGVHPANAAPVLSNLVSSLYGGGHAASPLHPTTSALTALNLQSLQLQMLAALVNPQVTPQPQPQPQPQHLFGGINSSGGINSLDLLSAASRLATPASVGNHHHNHAVRTVSDAATSHPSASNAGSSLAATLTCSSSSHPSDTSSDAAVSERPCHARHHRTDSDANKASSTTANSTSRNEPFTSSRPIASETTSSRSSGSSSPGPATNESGSDSCSSFPGTVAAPTISSSEKATSDQGQEREREDPPKRIYNNDEESSVQSKGAMPTITAETGAPPTGGTGTLRRHFTSRRKVGESSSSRSSSSVSMSESGSDSSTQQATTLQAKLSPTERKVETASTALRQAAFPSRPKASGPGGSGSDSQSSSSEGLSGSDSCNSALKKLWDLVSSADESNGSAIPLLRASRGLVGALIDGDAPSDSLEDSGVDSDAISAQQSSARASSQKKQRVEGSEDGSSNGARADGVSPGSRSPLTLDVAAKAMTLGILWGMATAEKGGGGGSVGPPLSEVTGIQSEGPRDLASNADDALDLKSLVGNLTLHTSAAKALKRDCQKMQIPVESSDDGSDDALRTSSVSGSSDEGDSQRVCVAAKSQLSRRHHDGGKGGADGRRKRSATAAFEPPAEVTWAHKRKQPSASTAEIPADAPSAKRRARGGFRPSATSEPSPLASSSSSQQSSEADGAKAGPSASGRREPGIMRSLSSLTTHLSDCSTVSSKKLGKRRQPTPPTEEKTRAGASVPSNSAWNQTSDISGEDFETGSSQSGSGSSNNGEPVVSSSGVSSGSTSRPPATSSSAGDSSALSSSGDDSKKAGEAASALDTKVATREPPKKRLKALFDESEKVQQ